jgi:hypothetical protein
MLPFATEGEVSTIFQVGQISVENLDKLCIKKSDFEEVLLFLGRIIDRAVVDNVIRKFEPFLQPNSEVFFLQVPLFNLN